MIPSVTPNNQELPYNDPEITWEKFQKLCCRLAKAKFEIDARIYLPSGMKQDGIDIVGLTDQDFKDNSGNEGFYFVEKRLLSIQCKKEKNFTSSKIKKAVSEFLEGKFKTSTKIFILCCSSSLIKYEDQIVQEKQRLQKEGIELLIWDSNGLDEELKAHPKIVYDFFSYEWVKRFCGEEVAKQFLPLPSPITYPTPSYFVPRKVSYIEKDIQYSGLLIDILQQKLKTGEPAKILLKGYAGTGKSTELEYIAAYLFNPPIFPIKLSLKSYVNEDIGSLLDLHCPNWQALKKETLFILDGLDEVKAEERSNFIRKLSGFLEAKKDWNYLISCRSNFVSDLTYFMDFEHIEIKDFSDDDIAAYARQRLTLEELVNSFITSVTDSGLSEWIRNPFFLTQFMEIFLNTPLHLPKSRKEILEQIEKIRIDKDKRRYQIDDTEIDFELSLIHLAFGMNLLGINSMKWSEVRTLLDPTALQRIRQSSFVKSTETSIEFHHNIFQEYFVAKALSKSSINKVKDCITFQPEHLIIKPKWVNTIGIYLELTLTNSQGINPIIELIIEQQPTLLFNIEYELIDFNTRFELFKRILATPERTYGRGLHYEERLMPFVEIDKRSEVLAYLLKQVEDTQDAILKPELLFYISCANVTRLFGFEENIKRIVEKLIKESSDFTLTMGIRVLTKLNIYDQELSDYLVYQVDTTQNIRLRNEIYEYILKHQLVEQYTNFFIDGLQVFHEYSKKEHTKTLGQELDLIRGLKEVKSPTNIRKVLTAISVLSKELHDYDYLIETSFLSSNSFIQTFAHNLSLVYQEDNSILEDVLMLCFDLHKHYEKEYLTQLSTFFHETGTHEKTFWKILNRHTQHPENVSVAGWLVNEPIIQQCFQLFTKGAISKELIDHIIWGIYDSGKTMLAQSLQEQVRLFLNIPPPIDWESVRKKTEKNDLALLLDRDTFIKKVHKVFKLLKTNTITFDQIVNINRIQKPLVEENIVIHFLENSARNNMNLSKKDVLKWLLIDENWTWFAIQKLLGKVIHKKELSIAHYTFIGNWCQRQIPNANFKTAIWDNENGGWTVRNLENTICTFFQYLAIEFSEEVMLDMIYFDTRSLYSGKSEEENDPMPLSDIIIQKIGEEKVKKRVIQNINEGIKSRLILSNHIRLCKKLNITACLPMIEGILKSGSFLDSFDLYSSLNIYIELGGSIDSFAFIFNSFEPTNDFHWYLLERFVEHEGYRFLVGNTVLRLLGEGRIDRNFRAACLLIDAQKIEGLDILIERIINNDPVINAVGRRISTNELLSLPIDITKLKLMELLKKLLQTNITYNIFDNPIDFALDNLKTIGILSERTFTIIIQELKDVSSQYEKYAECWKVKKAIFDLEKDYYLQKVDFENTKRVKSYISTFLD